MKTQLYKHYSGPYILDTALEATQDILLRLQVISNNTLAYVEKTSIKNFFARY